MIKKKYVSGLAMGLVYSIGVFGADIYVSPDGNNVNSGSQAAPLKTLTKASQLARPGDTVYIAPGVYNENVKLSASGTSASRIKYISQKKWGAQIIGSGTEAMLTNNGSYVDIIGLDVSGPGRIGIMNQGSNVLISGNHVHDLKVSGGCTGNGGAGIVNSNYSSTDNDVIGNVVHDVGLPGSCNGVQGIYHSHLRGKVLNNIVYRVSSFGIHLWHAADNVLIANNTVFQNGSSRMGGGIVLGTGDAPGGIVLDNTKVINNIVYDNPAASITEYCYSNEACIGSNILISNNLVFKNGMGVSLKKGSHVATISADPQFVNYQANGSGDYHLKATSPAIDQGILAGAPVQDMEGNARSGAVDIGALEYKSPVVAVAQLSATSLSFGKVIQGQASAAQVVTLTNVGTGPLLISKSISANGDFVLGSGTCQVNATIAPKASCTVSVVFKPSVIGDRTGSLVIASNASNAAVSVSLAGTGIAQTKPVASVSASKLYFGKVKVGSRSAIQYITVTNTGTAPMVIKQVFALSGPFAFGNKGTCAVGVSYAPGQKCTVSLVFVPKVVGPQSGSIAINSNADSVSVALYGYGIK